MEQKRGRKNIMTNHQYLGLKHTNKHQQTQVLTKSLTVCTLQVGMAMTQSLFTTVIHLFKENAVVDGLYLQVFYLAPI